jgi:alkylhydroperoxidase family enzyme
VAAAYERDREALGYVANYTKIFARRPAVYEAWRGLNGAIKASMDPRRYELATVAAALRLRSSYCSLAHAKVLVEQLDGAAAVPALLDGHGDLDPVERAVVRLADTVAAGAATMTEGDLTELRELGLDDAEILDASYQAYATKYFHRDTRPRPQALAPILGALANEKARDVAPESLIDDRIIRQLQAEGLVPSR